MSVSFEFFEGLDLRVFYRVARSGSMEEAILRAVRREDGYDARVERRDGVLIVRMKSPLWGRARKVFEIREGEIPRAWRWWTPPPRRRGWRLVFENPDGTFAFVEGPTLTDREVFCDLCGDWIPFRPLPLLLGSDALCSRCMRNTTGVSLEEAAAMDGVALQWLEEE